MIVMKHPWSNPALNLAPFGRWTLRDKACAAPVSLNVRRCHEN